MQFAFITSFLHDISKSTNLDKINHDQVHNCLQDHYLLEFFLSNLTPTFDNLFSSKRRHISPCEPKSGGLQIEQFNKKTEADINRSNICKMNNKKVYLISATK